MSKIGIDTNILVYLFDEYFIEKREIAGSLVDAKPIICTQIVSEFLNVSKRLLKISKLDILRKCNESTRKCIIVPTSQVALNHAEKLITRYDLQLFDAIIVASAIEANCTILYSEDMQHSFVVEGTLTIINPFV